MPVVRDASMVPAVTVTPEQRDRALELMRKGGQGYVRALRAAGVAGSSGQLRAHLAENHALRVELEDARLDGLDRYHLDEETLFTALGAIAGKEGPSQLRAVVYALGLHGIHLGDHSTVEHTGRLEVDNPDVAAAIERFTSLADAAIRSAARVREDSPARGALPGGES